MTRAFSQAGGGGGGAAVRQRAESVASDRQPLLVAIVSLICRIIAALLRGEPPGWVGSCWFGVGMYSTAARRRSIRRNLFDVVVVTARRRELM